MKKILFLLLLSVAMYGQVPADATPLENIQITNNAQDNVSTKVAVQTNDGVINWKYIADIDVKTKARLSTGLLKNGLISANGDPTKFNITSGIGIISNFDDPENPTSTIINFPAFTGITPTYLLTGTITYVAINSTPAVVMQATPFTPEQRRSLIVLGAVIHSNLTTINVLNNISAPSNASTNQLHDFIEAVGALNLTGNKYTANGANLQLNKSAGLIFKLGSNFANDWKNPHELAQTAGTSLTFRYRTQNGTEGSDRINLDPALYDLNNVLTSVPNNKFTIQTVTMFQSGLTRIQYGQNVYDDLATAKNAVFTRNFVLEPNSKENGIIRAYIIMRNTTTSLQTVADADILEAQKFGGVASGGVSLTLANIVTALGYTPENVANKDNGALTNSATTYPTSGAVKAVTDANTTAIGLKQNTLSNPTTGVGSQLDPISYALQDGTILYHSTKWFAPSGAVSTSGTTVTSVGTQFTSAMVGAKLTINGEWRIITAFTSTTVVTVASAYSQNYSGVVAESWGIYSKAFEVTNIGNRYMYNTIGQNQMDNNFFTQGLSASYIANSDNTIRIINVYLAFGADRVIQWSSTTGPNSINGIKDLGIRRNSAGVLEIYDGITATGLEANRRDLLARNIFSSKSLVGTSVDAGFILDVNGTTRLQNTLTLGTSPTTSAGTYDFLTRNTSTGVVEKVLSNTIATTASPTLTGIPTAPTATAGTNTTQIATTAFVLANATSIPQLESNATDLTVWNNGKGNVSGNTSFGELTLRSNTTGSQNTANGAGALGSNTTGTANTANGWNAMVFNTTGSQNTSVGRHSLSDNISGTNNTAIGNDSGRFIADGITPNTSVSSSVFLGAFTKPLASGQTNQIVIGESAIGAGSNTATLGNTSITSTILRGTVTTNGSFVNSSAPATNALLANGTTLANPISGTGTTNFLSKFTSSGVIGNSLVFDNGTNVGIGTTDPAFKLDVNGSANFSSSVTAGGNFRVLAGSSINLNRPDNGAASSILTNSSNQLVFESPLGALFSSSVTATSFNGSATLTGTPTAPTATAGTNTTQIATTAFVQLTRPYKVYTALLTQTGTAAPTATVLENTLGGTIVWSYSIAGEYIGTLTGAFLNNKTFLTIKNNIHNTTVEYTSSIGRIDNNKVVIGSKTDSVASDGTLNASIEIRVYN